MKIVLIARTIYPLLSPRAFRTTELAKQFARQGHDVVVYAVLGDYDYTLFEKKYGIKVKPIKMRLATFNSDGNSRYNLLDRIMFHAFHWLIEYPDIEFCWKIPQILQEERNVDLLITIAVPHPIHWGTAIAKRFFKRNFPEKWISDCGDPYLGTAVGRKHPFYFRYVEDFWGKETDFVTVPLKEACGAYRKNVQNKIRVIPQGFDFSEVELSDKIDNEIPHFAYAGSIYKGQRDPSSFLAYLCELKQKFVFTVYTKNPQFYQCYKERLGEKLIVKTYVERRQLIYELSKQDFLINLVNPSSVQSPSKLIDYLLTKRPIVDISTPFVEKNAVERAFHGKFDRKYESVDIQQYNIVNVADKFLSL